jgi:hypothetical protein
VRGILAVAATLLAAGCATFEDQLASHLQSPSLRECAQWFVALDERIDAAGVRDAQYSRVAGFPYLRVDRPLASLRDRAAESPGTIATFAQRLRGLDYDARRHEIDNLSPEALPGARADVLHRTQECGTQLVAADLASAQGRTALVAAARVLDSARFVLGEEGAALERELAARAGVSLRVLDKAGFERGIWFDEPQADGGTATVVGCTLDVARVLA